MFLRFDGVFWWVVLFGDSLDCFRIRKGILFHYSEIAKEPGVKGERVKLPGCVYRKIAKTFPDPDGPSTKVGFKRSRDE